MKKHWKLLLFISIEFLFVITIVLLTVYAGNKTYTVTFDVNGGTYISGNLVQTVRHGQSATPPVVTKDGAFLLEWSEDYKTITKDEITEKCTNGENITTPKDISGDYYLYIYAEDELQNETIYKSNVFKIDNKPPTVDIKYNPAQKTKENVTVKLRTDEEVQDIELEGWTLSENKKELTKTYTENKTETINLKDKLGNETRQTITINNTMYIVNKNTEVKAKTTKTTTKKTSTRKTTSAKKTTTSKKSTTTKRRTSKKVPNIIEYYDLPDKYDKTMVKLLFQTPKRLFVYWEISEADRKLFLEKNGEDFFENTVPYLVVKNKTKNYTFEIEINDYANSWYFDIPDSNSEYDVELIRKNKISNISVPITTSNHLEVPNNKILFDQNRKEIFFKNVKTETVTSKNIANIQFISHAGNIQKAENFYTKFYKESDLVQITNPTS